MDTKNGEVDSVEIATQSPASFAPRHQALMNEYLERLRTRQCGRKTVARHQWAVELLFAWLGARGCSRVQDATHEDITGFLAHHRARLAEATLAGLATTVRQFLRYLEQTQRLFVNPMAAWIIRKTPVRLKPVPSEDDMQRLLEAPEVTKTLGIRDRAILETAYSTGARLSELLGMQLRDPDFDKGLVRVLGKGRKERVLPLGRHALAWLLRYVKSARSELLKRRRNLGADEAALWLNRDGGPLGQGMMELIFSNHARAAGLRLRITPHAVRRACVTHMLRHGAHPVQLQQLLGHATLETLCHYLRVSVQDLKRMHAHSQMGR